MNLKNWTIYESQIGRSLASNMTSGLPPGDVPLAYFLQLIGRSKESVRCQGSG